MLEVATDHPLEAVEGALRRAAQRHGAAVLSAAHVGRAGADAIVFLLCHAELYGALLGADIRLAAFLPCRVAACAKGGRVMLEAISPLEFGRLLNRPDLVQLTGPLESVLCQIMEETARMPAEAAHPAAGLHRGGLGATEDQVSLRASIPQRIDCRGTKVEDLGGTGQVDAPGG